MFVKFTRAPSPFGGAKRSSPNPPGLPLGGSAHQTPPGCRGYRRQRARCTSGGVSQWHAAGAINARPHFPKCEPSAHPLGTASVIRRGLGRSAPDSTTSVPLCFCVTKCGYRRHLHLLAVEPKGLRQTQTLAENAYHLKDKQYNTIRVSQRQSRVDFGLNVFLV